MATFKTNEQIRAARLIVTLNDLRYFIPAIHKDYGEPLHLLPLINELNEILKGKQKYIVISCPPLHGKTETIISFIAQYLNKFKNKTVTYSTYSQTLSESKSIKIVAILEQLGIKPNPKLANRSEWRIDNFNGGLLTTSVQGTSTGMGSDLYVIDDPIKDRIEANSKVYRDRTWDWFTDVVETRLEPNASIIIILTRWHEDDLAGRILKERKRYKFIRLPALADGLSFDGKTTEPDILGREIGEALWGKRYSKEYLEQAQNEKQMTFVSLYQGLPRRPEDSLFHEPCYYNELPKEGFYYSIACDLAYTEKQSSDYSVCAILMKTKEDDKSYIIKIDRWKSDITATKAKLHLLQDKYNIKFGIEDNGVQKAVYDMLFADKIKVMPLKPIGDKYTRALPYAERWNAGKILLPNPEIYPESKNWVNEYLEEVLNFTGINDVHDDQVDASVYADSMSKTGTSFNMNSLQDRLNK